MKEYNPSTTEQALTMYMETVSPSQDNLKTILSHIPEKKKQEKGRAVRSPYMWLGVTEFVMLCSIMLAVLPTALTLPNDGTIGYTIETSIIDMQINNFEVAIDEQDYQTALQDESVF